MGIKEKVEVLKEELKKFKWKHFPECSQCGHKKKSRLLYDGLIEESPIFDEYLLDPFDDYTYVWSYYALEDMVSLIEKAESTEHAIKILEREDFCELADNLTDVYTSDLLDWLAAGVGNVERLGEGAPENVTGPGLIAIAQSQAILEHIDALKLRVIKFLRKEG